MRLFFFLFVLAWVVGIILGTSQQSGFIVWGGMVLTGVVAWLARVKLPIIITVGLLVGLGYLWTVDRGDDAGRDCVVNGRAEGEIVGWPDVRINDTRLVVEAGGCRIIVYVSRHAEVSKGDIVKMRGGEVQTMDKVRNFSEGYARYLQRRGISLMWRYPDIQVVQAGSSWTQHVRNWLSSQITRLFVEPDASLVQAMLIAKRGTLPNKWVDQFRATGVSHVLAISGLHVSILTGLVVVLIQLLPVKPWPRTILAASLLWMYVWLIGVPVSAIRATSFWTLTLLAFRMHRLVNLPTVLMLTVVTILTLDPQLALEVGFQLSVSAVIGIFLTLFLTGRFLHKQGDIGKWLWSLVAVSTGAFLGTAPLVAYHFGNVALVSIVANLLVVPVVPFVLSLAIISIIVSAISWPLALSVSFIVHGLVIWMDFVTESLARIPFVFVEEVNMPLWLIFVYYGVAAFVSMYFLYRQGRSWREVWG